ncbi:MAG: HD domain-containing protein [Chitinophagaceae bacterium]
MVNINIIRDHVISKLKKELPETLTYHNADHSLSVLIESTIIAKEEGISDENALLELQIAALYHDTGLLFGHTGHEEKSCEIAKKDLPPFGVNKNQIQNICEIILATKMPQAPKNILQQIICDADLDYLGRNDFFVLSDKLRTEFRNYKIIRTDEEWESSRIAFLQSHAYFTTSSQKRRNPGKHLHLKQLINTQIKK